MPGITGGARGVVDWLLRRDEGGGIFGSQSAHSGSFDMDV